MKLLCAANNFSELIDHRALFVNGKLRVTDAVDEKDMGDLQPDLFFRFGRHSGTESKLREFHYLLHLLVSRAKAEFKFSLYCFGACEATIFSKVVVAGIEGDLLPILRKVHARCETRINRPKPFRAVVEQR